MDLEDPAPLSVLSTAGAAEIPIYCINLAASTGRRERMEARFAALGLTDRVHVIEAIDRSSNLVDEHLERSGWSAPNDRRRSEVACLLSHVLTLRTFLRDTPASVGSAIVFEDDVLLHRDWNERLERVLGNVPIGTPVCALGHTSFQWYNRPWSGINPFHRNLVPMELGVFWGAHGYWLTRQHAQEAVDRFEHQPIGDGFVSEFLVWNEGGLVARPPLVIEEGSMSTIGREDYELEARLAGVRHWGAENYLSAPSDRQLFGSSPAEKSQSICLCMIVRNESQVIDRLADSVRDLIDSWVICDTGSNDGTPEAVRRAFGDIPGQLFSDEWRDYGTNRTLMLERARGRADYLLILDADQTLRIEGRLPRLDAEAYALLVDESLAHWVPRLVKGDLPWRYVGSAHEYITCGRTHQTEMLPLLVVEHHADGGNRPDKLERELELLQRDLADDPNNPRTVFYIAQTYRDLGEDELAIEHYARRIQLGSFEEEMFYSMYQHAVLVGRTDWDLGVSLLLDTWEFRPSRVEPLYALARGYRLRNQFQLGALFAARGIGIPVRDGEFFVHRDHYEWGLEFEWAMCVFNLQDFAGALPACDRLLAFSRLPDDVREYVSGIRQRCRVALGRAESTEDMDAVVIRAGTAPLSTLLSGVRVGEIRLSVDPPWPQFNPSIAADGDGFRMLVRTSNYTLANDVYRTIDGDPVIRSIHYEVAMGPDLSVADVRPVLDAVSPPDLPGLSNQGIEDCRLVQVGGRWLALVVGRAFDPSGRSQVGLVDLVDGRFDNLRLLKGPDAARHEKNWMPFVLGEELFIVYSCWPTIVLRCDVATGDVTEVAHTESSFALSEERGGSQGVAVDDGILFVTHRVTLPEGRRLYQHRFVLMEPETMQLRAASPRFRFLDARVEFCCGMARADDDLVLSVGASDAHALLARVPYEEVRASLWPL